nr:MAG TPA: hypothetical protein [Caudoviricetes sp.]
MVLHLPHNDLPIPSPCIYIQNLEFLSVYLNYIFIAYFCVTG